MNYNDKQYRESESRQGCGKTVLIALLTFILVIISMFYMCSCSDNEVSTMAPDDINERGNFPGWILVQANTEYYHLTKGLYDPAENVLVFFNDGGFEIAYFMEGLNKFNAKITGDYKIMVVVNSVFMYEASEVSYDRKTDKFWIDDDLSFTRAELTQFEFWQTPIKSKVEDEAVKYYTNKFSAKKTINGILSKKIQSQGLL